MLQSVAFEPIPDDLKEYDSGPISGEQIHTIDVAETVAPLTGDRLDEFLAVINE